MITRSRKIRALITSSKASIGSTSEFGGGGGGDTFDSAAPILVFAAIARCDNAGAMLRLREAVSAAVALLALEDTGREGAAGARASCRLADEESS
jgi:hypothetical protein